jgi:hypothetical protein
VPNVERLESRRDTTLMLGLRVLFLGSMVSFAGVRRSVPLGSHDTTRRRRADPARSVMRGGSPAPAFSKSERQAEFDAEF